ncbi:cytochrome P450 [Schizophyllum commune Loenen D]|nr:cytochrome P450 [Schizophyllum commune Loenen D]
MSSSDLLIYSAFACALVTAGYKVLRIGSREQNLPPGPPTVPLLGNALQIPRKFTFYRFTEWARVYGEIYSLKIGPGTAIVLSSPAVLKQVLDKQSADTSDRPQNSVLDLVTDGWNLFLCRYSDRWRQLRKAAQTLLAASTVKNYLPIQEAESTQLQFDLLTSPEKFYGHIERFGISIVMSIVYGKRAPRIDAPIASAFVHENDRWSALLMPGATPPVDALPFLKYLPEFLAPWKKETREIRALQRELYCGIFDECKKRVEAGDANFFMAEVIKEQAANGLTREQASLLGGALYEAGAESSACFLHNLVLVLAAHPHVQAKAHAELDHVVGDTRLPTYEDAEHLPYVQAIINETHRFRTLVPLALPHRVTKDTQYKGYLIPEGASVFGDLHAVYHDPELFEDPDVFNPDRYLTTPHGTRPGVDDSDMRSTFIFGYGRRICPGMHLATVSALLATMKLLWGFEFRPPTDPATGKEIPLDLHMNREGAAIGPPHFKCNISVRSPERAAVIERAFRVETTRTLSAFEYNLAREDKEWLETVRAG